MALDVVTFGETMVLLTAREPGRLRHATELELRIAGAESNVAIALARLGFRVGWISWLGADELGEAVLARVRAEGVDTAQVRRLGDAPTGLCLRERLPTGVSVYYYRQGSAASRMGPGAFDPAYLDGARVLHVTGITPALSPSCRELTLWATAAARQRRLRVSFDVNYRSKLWDPQSARALLAELLPQVDVVFVSAEEAETLWGASDVELLRRLSAQYGCAEVVLKCGERGAVALIDGERWEAPAFRVEVRDPIGAGDAFAAGYIAASLWGKGPGERLRIANAMGAFSVAALGDYEGLPGREELEAFLNGCAVPGR